MLPQQAVAPCDTAVVEQHVLAYIGLGANVGDAQWSLERAVSALSVLPAAALAGVSRLYRTRPVGPVKQVDFRNAVVALRVPAGAAPADGAMSLLVELKGLERVMGRVDRQRWGPREIDLDLLLFGNHALRVERATKARSDDRPLGSAQWLEVPHPSAAARLFVLAPLADLAPDLRPPGWTMSVEEARARAEASEGRGAVSVTGEWDYRTARWLELAQESG